MAIYCGTGCMVIGRHKKHRCAADLVEAAKQRRGRLEIATPDSLVSVKGTIFGVSWGLKGSRVSVVQGEVQVVHSGVSKLLHRGEQFGKNLFL